MQLNSDKCEHCGKVFVRFTRDTPVVNRSDGETFHVSLYSCPSFTTTRAVYTFVYCHDEIGPHNEFVTVRIPFPASSPRKAAQQIEEVADKISELVQGGKRLDYLPRIFEKGQLRMVLPGE